MSSFSDLLGKNNAEKQEDVDARKSNPFAALEKAVASAAIPPPSATAAGEVSGQPISPKETSPAPFSFNLGKIKEPSSDVATVSEPVANASLATEDATPPDDTMQGISGEIFSERKAAAEFQASDQPEGYNQEVVDELKNSLDILVGSIDNKELVGDALKKIMLDLKRHQFLINIMHPEDCQLMVRAVRESYGVTLAKKQTRSTKRSTSQKEVEDVLDVLADVEISL